LSTRAKWILGIVMGDFPKVFLVILIAGVIGSQAFKAIDIDYLASSPEPGVSSAAAVSIDEAIPEPEVEAILAGADPTDVMEPTASGKRQAFACDTGYIVGDMDSNRFSKISYAAFNQDGITYIQVSKYNPSYLVQEGYQIVSATEVDSVPDSVKQQLQEKINNPRSCNSLDLYLSNVKYLK